MAKNKSSISKASSYKEMGEFWDTNDLTEFTVQENEVEFEVDIQSEVTYYAIDKILSGNLQKIARERGISADTLLNLWLQEKLREIKI